MRWMRTVSRMVGCLCLVCARTRPTVTKRAAVHVVVQVAVRVPSRPAGSEMLSAPGLALLDGLLRVVVLFATSFRSSCHRFV